jgi:hypothetical protein
MAVTYQKRQREMKRLEKQRQKAERRAQRKITNREQKGLPAESRIPPGDETGIGIGAVPPESSRQK